MALGRLVLVVGPSGVGKDALIGGAREALQANATFSFVRRVVTRPARVDVEDHDSMSPAAFEAAQARGRFVLVWEAHGLRYGLPNNVATDLALGRVVIANVSRHVVGEAMARFPGAMVVLVRADTAQRAQRLEGRGREGRMQIEQRLAREGPTLPASIQPIVLDNSGSLAAGINAFVLILKQAADSLG
jgi:ribose 1,5-bisphosphokinase